MNPPVLTALFLSFLAGMATTVGGAAAFFIKKPTFKILSLTLGFSAGVMISVSFVELLPRAMEQSGFIYANLAFFAGILAIFAIDFFVPHEYIAEKISRKNAWLKQEFLPP